MKQITDKLNDIAKAIDESVELPTSDLIVDSLDAITKAFGGTPSESGLIVDKLDDIAKVATGGGGGGSTGEVLIPEQTVIITAVDYEWTEVELSGVKIDTTNFPVYIPLTVNGVTVSEVYGVDIGEEGIYFYSGYADFGVDIAYKDETGKWYAGSDQSGTYTISSIIVPDTNEYITLFEEQTIIADDGELVIDTDDFILPQFIPVLKISLDGIPYHASFDFDNMIYPFGWQHDGESKYGFGVWVDGGEIYMSVFGSRNFEGSHTVKIEAPLPKTTNCVVKMTGNSQRAVFDYFKMAERYEYPTFYFVTNDNIIVPCNSEYITNENLPASYYTYCFIALSPDNNGATIQYCELSQSGNFNFSNIVNIASDGYLEYNLVKPVDLNENSSIEIEYSAGDIMI